MAFRQVALSSGSFTPCVMLAANSVDYQQGDTYNEIFTEGTDIYSIVGSSETTIYQSSVFRFTVQLVDAENKAVEYKAYYNDTLFWVSGSLGWSGQVFQGVAFGVDDDLEQGQIFVCSDNGSGWRYSITNGDVSSINKGTTYLAITGSEQPPYTWSSVPAISGKNGILSLSTLNDINDGNPVTTSDVNKFYLAKASNLSTLINNAINL